MAFLISAFPSPERELSAALSNQLQELFPQAHLIRVFCRGMAALPGEPLTNVSAELTADSLEHAVALCLSRQQKRHGSNTLTTSTLADISGACK